MVNRKISVAITILLITLISLTSFFAYKSSTSDGFCLIPENSDSFSCSAVQNSEYSKLFGIKLYDFGKVCFSVLLIIYAISKMKTKNKKIFSQLFVAATTIGAAFALYFLYIQAFILRTFCSNCLLIDGIAIIIFFLALAEYPSK